MSTEIAAALNPMTLHHVLIQEEATMGGRAQVYRVIASAGSCMGLQGFGGGKLM